MLHHQHHETDHYAASLHHQLDQSRSRVSHHLHEIQHTEHLILADTREFATHLDAHNIEYRNVEGLETAIFPIHSQTDTARYYMWASIAALIIAIIFAIWFSSISFAVENTYWLYALAIIISIVVGFGASLLVRALFDAHSLNPVAVRKINITLVISGGLFAVLLALFLWTRFNPDAWLADHIAYLMTGIEISALVFSGASDCAYRVYRWSDHLHRKHRAHLDQLAHHQHELQAERSKLHDLESRLGHHEHLEHHEPHNGNHHHHDITSASHGHHESSGSPTTPHPRGGENTKENQNGNQIVPATA